MPRGIYTRTETMRKNYSLSKRGHIVTEETKIKIGLANKGKPSPRKGIHLSKETKEKLSKSNKGKHRSEETRKKMSLARLGKFPTKETRQKMSKTRKGNTWEKIFGQKKAKEMRKKQSLRLRLDNEKRWKDPEYRKRMSLIRKGWRMGEKHPLWKGDKVGYSPLHRYIKSRKPKPKLCEFCGKEKDRLGHTRLALANIKNHQYSRNPDDYKWGHYSCHADFDFLNELKSLDIMNERELKREKERIRIRIWRISERTKKYYKINKIANIDEIKEIENLKLREIEIDSKLFGRKI